MFQNRKGHLLVKLAFVHIIPPWLETNHWGQFAIQYVHGDEAGSGKWGCRPVWVGQCGIVWHSKKGLSEDSKDQTRCCPHDEVVQAPFLQMIADVGTLARGPGELRIYYEPSRDPANAAVNQKPGPASLWHGSEVVSD